VIKTVVICLSALTLAAASQAGATGSSPNSYFSQHWTPDGTALIYQARLPWQAIQRVTLGGEISTVLDQLDPVARISVRGELAYVAQGDVTSPRGILTVRSASGVSRAIAQAREYGGLAWSPDGGQIAFQAAGGRVALVGADGRGLRELAAVGSDPAWSPDGTRIAFSQGAQTAVIDVTSGVARVVGPAYVSADGFHVFSAYPGAVWSPDSTRLAINLPHGIQVVRSDGGGMVRLLRDASLPSWSPDGAELAVVRDGNVVAASATGSSERVIVASAMREATPTWSPDGRWIAYTNYNDTPPEQAFQEGHATDVFVVRPDGSGRKSLTGGCGVGPETPLAWVCVVNGRYAVPLRDARSPKIRITPWKYERAVRIRVFLTDGARYVYGARVTVRQLSGQRVRVTSTFGKPPSLLSDTGGRAAFRFLKPKKHGKLTFRVVAAGQARLLTLRV
jgi:TolB protein